MYSQRCVIGADRIPQWRASDKAVRTASHLFYFAINSLMGDVMLREKIIHYPHRLLQHEWM